MFDAGFPILSLIILLPLAGIVLLLIIPGSNKPAINITAVTAISASLLLTLIMYKEYNGSTGGYQFIERYHWLKSYGISFHVGVDGISLILIVLSAILSLISVISSFKSVSSRYKEYMITLLFLQTGMTGVFAAMDMFLFFIFWEVILIPMFILIALWGGKERIYASIKFFLFTLAGSTMMLISIIYIAYMCAEQTGHISYDFTDIFRLKIDPGIQLILFLAFALSFAIKVPLFPFHTWLPDAHTEAPTAGSVILAGVLLKMGTYGFLRFNLPLFPDAAAVMAPYMIGLSIVGIIYGALMAMVQPDMKKLVAYSSVSHMGFIMLGIFSLNEEGLTGAVLQMINHGISTGMLFLLVGMIYDRRHTRLIADYGGIARTVPVFATFFMIAALSSIGLPGMNGFVGEIMIMIGGFMVRPLYGILAASGVILSAVYMLWMYKRVIFGPVTHEENNTLKDLDYRERLILVPLVLLIFWIGIYPQPLISKYKSSVNSIVQIHEKHSIPGAITDVQKK
jgi:NADH-quinone oxidoreductase subunit M